MFTELLARANPGSNRGPPKRTSVLYPCNSICIHQKTAATKLVKRCAVACTVLWPLSYGDADMPPVGFEPTTTSLVAM